MAAAYVRLLRPGDWVKNVFVLPALVFALPVLREEGGADLAGMLAATGAAVAAFCLISSGFYAINDVMDAPTDRLHPVKRLRPIASGAIGPGAGVALGVGLVLAGLAVGAAVNRGLVLVLGTYALLQVGYNLKLKRVILVDVMVVAIGFALRAAAGALAIEVKMSVWLVLCVFFLCLFLGFTKRLCDIVSAERAGQTDWRSPAGYGDRIELNWLLGVSAVLAVVTYLMYALSPHARSLFGTKAVGFALLTPLVLVAFHRFYRRASTASSDSPLAALREDRAVIASVLLFAAGTIITLYVPAVETLLERLFELNGAAGP